VLNSNIVNADVNGAYNILLKAIPKAFDVEEIEAVMLHSVRITHKENYLITSGDALWQHLITVIVTFSCN